MASGILALLGKPKKGAPPDEEAGGLDDDTEEAPEGDAGEMAAADFAAAQKSGDHAGMFEAFERMFQACESKPHDEYEKE